MPSSSNSELLPGPVPPPRHPVAFALIGVIGGLLFGVFGAGGGVVMVPLLIWLGRLDQRHAAATSLVAVAPIAVFGSLGYLIAGNADVAAAVFIASGGVVGSVIGARLLRSLPLGWLRWLFIALLLAIDVRLVFFPLPAGHSRLDLELTNIVALVLLGLAMGIAAGLFGIGGGVIVIPVLVAGFLVDDLVARGTALLAIIPTALTGGFVNIRAGLVDARSTLVLAACAAVASLAGSALAKVLPPALSSLLFEILLTVIVAQLLVRAVVALRRH